MGNMWEKVMPIWSVENAGILSKMGDYTIGFEVTKPEIFTLSAENYELLHQTFLRAIKVMPAFSIVHMQDWFTEEKYKPDKQSKHGSFLNEAADRHFEGRKFLGHRSYLYLTKKATKRRAATSATSALLRRNLFPADSMSPDVVRDFVNSVGQFKKIVEDSELLQLRQLQDEEIWSYTGKTGVLEQYCYLNEPDEAAMVRDITFGEDIRIGEKYCQLFTLADAEKLPSQCGTSRIFERYSTDRTKFPVGFASGLGLLLPCNHVFNQYIFIEDSAATLKKLEGRRLRLQSLSNYSRENAVAHDAVNDFLNEAVSEQRLPVKAHFNVLTWTDSPAEARVIRNAVSSAIAQMDASPYLETVGAPQVWYAGIPGNAGEMPLNETFDTFLEQAICFFSLETNYRSAPPAEGIRFCDRLSSRPVFVDLYDAPRRAGVTSNLGTLVCGTSGGGKSMTVNHLLRTLHDQGAHCVIVDIGGSYRGLCELLKGYYFTYTEANPIRFNPFYLPPGEVLGSEKKESLKALLVGCWKQEHETFNRSEYVGLSNALQMYYDKAKTDPDLLLSFNSFYEFCQTEYREVLKAHRVKDKDFDIDNFLYVLRPYYAGGEFDYLLNSDDKKDLLNHSLVVIELDNIKDHPILMGVTLLITMEMVISKMRKLGDRRKVLAIDEAWKAIAKSGMADFIKYAFKTIRKFNGVPIVITQELDDLVSSPVIKDAIINNADIKILMDMRKFVNKFDKLQEVLGLSEKAKSILLSVNKDNREIFVDLGGQETKVYRNELSPHEYFAYTTDGKERVKVLQYAEQYGSMEDGIKKMVEEMKTNK